MKMKIYNASQKGEKSEHKLEDIGNLSFTLYSWKAVLKSIALQTQLEQIYKHLQIWNKGHQLQKRIANGAKN